MREQQIKIAGYLIIIFSSVCLFACQPVIKNKSTLPQKQKVAQFSQCTEPRPEICTREYRPVCASKDTGVRCVTTPCPSTKNVTYATACTACSDKKVSGYILGACQ